MLIINKIDIAVTRKPVCMLPYPFATDRLDFSLSLSLSLSLSVGMSQSLVLELFFCFYLLPLFVGMCFIVRCSSNDVCKLFSNV